MKSADPHSILRTYFGYNQFRQHQKEAIDALLNGKDTFVLMPTGGGKSICYQVPALLLPGLTVVVSPLIALMKDQVDALVRNGVNAGFFNSSMSMAEQQIMMSKVKSGDVKLLYVAPERLQSGFLETLKGLNVSLFAIDEAHCISHWGHDFRPDYMLLSELKKHFPGTPVAAFTASADQTTRLDIIDKLNLNNPLTLVSSFNRANIRYEVRQTTDDFQDLLNFLEKHPEESGIIYTLRRDSTEAIAADLENHGYRALPYHAGLNAQKRAKHQELFLKDEVPIIVATIAFGMGIDKSNVRFVVHMNMPKNIESYYQETGRAGRDGLKSIALLYFNRSDIGTLSYFARVEDNEQQSKIMLKKLYQMADFCEATTCRRKLLLEYFDEPTKNYCGNCDVCLGNYDEWDATIPAQKAMSAVVRLRGQYGINMLVDFLRGSMSQKIKPWMREIKTFGVGREFSKEEWIRLFNNLISAGYLEQTMDKYPLVKITESGKSTLVNGEKIMLTRKKEIVHTVYKDDSYNEELFNILKYVRKSIADEESVPAYIILSDRSLMELARYYPRNREDLKLITGFGEVKINKYGDHFLRKLNHYCSKEKLESRMHKIPRSRKKSEKSTSARTTDKRKKNQSLPSHHVTFSLFQEGKSPEEIARERDMVPGTIMAHLAKVVEEGNLNAEDIIDSGKVDQIREIIEAHPDARLKEIKELLGEDYSYGDIRIVKTYLAAN